MAYSNAKYVADGITTIFSIPFPYLEKAHIKVYVNGVETPFVFMTDSTVQLDSPPAKDTVVTVQRETPLDRKLVDFQNTSILLESSLDKNTDQVLFVNQEQIDKTRDLLAVDVDNKYDAKGRGIKNVADPVNDNDVMNFKSAKDAIAKTSASANAAKISETNAKTSETNAKTSETKAKTSEINSLSSENKAKKWSEEVENVEVEPGLYSAKHHAIKSISSASAALASQNAAKTSENNAKISETNAKISETNASNSASAALASQNAAKTSETNASNSALIATTKANEAASSASAALASQNAAKTSETNAAQSAQSAAASAAQAAADAEYVQGAMDGTYTKAETDTLLAGKSNTSHLHDDRYYTETEINTKLNTKANSVDLNAHTGNKSNPHGVTVGQIGAETPAGSQAKVDAHANATSTHSATSIATANRIMMRDASGRAKVAAPSAADDIARKDTVDTVQTNLNAHTGNKSNPHGVTAAQIGAAPSSHVGSGGSAHALATTSQAGFMSSSDFNKLSTLKEVQKVVGTRGINGKTTYTLTHNLNSSAPIVILEKSTLDDNTEEYWYAPTGGYRVLNNNQIAILNTGMNFASYRYIVMN